MRSLALLVVLALLAGCFGGSDVPDARRFGASAGQVSQGWAYDGAGLAPGAATLDGVLMDGANTGLVNVSFDLGGERWVVTFDTFAQAEGRAFMDGGIEFELDEHGDTGVADASIPKIHAVVAAWGSAMVTRAGELAAPTPWSAHLMLAGDTVRGTDGKIAKADGATPYDPTAPADARRVEGDPQAIFWIKHPQGETFSRAPVNVTAAVSCQSPQCTDTAELGVEPGASRLENITITLTGPATPAPVPIGAVGQGRVSIVDANGTELAGADVAPAPDGPSVVVLGSPIPLAGVLLPLSVSLSGDGAFSAQVDAIAAFSDVPFVVVTWDEYTVESA